MRTPSQYQSAVSINIENYNVLSVLFAYQDADSTLRRFAAALLTAAPSVASDEARCTSTSAAACSGRRSSLLALQSLAIVWKDEVEKTHSALCGQTRKRFQDGGMWPGSPI